VTESCAVEPVPDPFVALIENRTVVADVFVTVHVAPAPLQPPPVQLYDVGWLVQFALTTVCCPTEGLAGLALGEQVGTDPPPDVTHVTVCVGGDPDTVKLVQLGFV
jgi:hypothetical protein